MDNKLQKQEKSNLEQNLEEQFVSPFCDIYENDDEIGIMLDMPGIPKENIDINFENNEITIDGKVTKEKEENEEDYYVREFGKFRYRRSFKLPNGLDSSKIKANYKDGSLQVTIPKSESVKPKKIKINTK